MSGISNLAECGLPRREVGERNAGVHGPVVNGESDLQGGGSSIVDGAQLPKASMIEYGLPEGKEENADWSALGTANFKH